MHIRKKGNHKKRTRSLHTATATHLDPLEPRQLFATTLYVDPASPGPTHDGTGWTSAYTDLQSALAAAGTGTTLHLAAGTYLPTTAAGRNASFKLKSGLRLLGGYAGARLPTNPDSRDPIAYPTILSGDIGAPGDNTDNAYNVITAVDTGPGTLLDGLTITAGNANTFALSRTSAGGGLYASAAAVTINNCSFTGNAANFGGGVSAADAASAIDVTNSTFSNNSVTNNGGAIRASLASLSIVGCTFTGNSANRGASLYLTSTNPTVSNTSFTNNKAAFGAGICDDSAASPAVTDCLFAANTGTTPGFGFGAGMYNSAGSAPIVMRCTFSANLLGTAFGSSSGGAMYNTSCSPTLTSCTFDGNSSASSGGAICNDEGSNPAITNCTFTNNSAGTNGGAICDIQHHTIPNGSAPTITHCTFSHNSAVFGDGGAIYNLFSSSPHIVNCLFIANSASSSGGAISNSSSANAATLDCAFVGNTAANGGAVSNASSSPVFVNCTFVANAATTAGGAINNRTAAFPAVTNSILRANTAPAGGDLDNDANSSATVSHCDLQNPYPGSDNLTADAVFFRNPSPGADNTWATADDDFGDLRLQPASPAIDAGDTATVPPDLTTDLAGSARVQGPAVDLGAYEAIADTTPPQLRSASSNASAQPLSGSTPLTVDATFTDETALDLTSISTANFLLTGPPGYTAAAATLTILASSPTSASVRYFFPPPGGTWEAGPFANYSVTLQPNQVRDTSNNYVVVNPSLGLGPYPEFPPPTATLTASPAPEGTPITVSLTNPFGAAPFKYAFDFNDDGTFDAVDTTASALTIPAPFLPADGPASITVRARVTDYWGRTVDHTTPVTVTNVAPTVSLAPVPANLTEGGAYSLSASATDPSVADTSAGFTYAWTITRAGNTVASGTGPTIPVNPADNGTYTLAVTATDKDGGTSTPASVSLPVANIPPAAAIAGLPTANFTLVNHPLTLTASATDPSAADTAAGFTYAWTATLNGQPLASATTAGFSFTPTAPGALAISLTVTDKDGAVSAPATSSIPVFVPDTTPPAASIAPGLTAPTFGFPSYTFTVTYTDDTAIAVSALDNADLLVTGPNGFSALATLRSATPTGPTVTATYTFPAPDNAWTSADNGPYTIALLPNQVTDTSANPAPAATLATLTVNLAAHRPGDGAPDTTPPTAALAAAAPLAQPTAGAPDYTFSVTYTDDTEIDFTTLGAGDLLVTGPHGFSAPAVLQGTTGSGASITATYAVQAPGGSWDHADNGTYTLLLQPNQIADSSNNPALPGPLGSLTVALDNPDTPILATEQGTANPASPNLVVATFALKKPKLINGALLGGTPLSGTVNVKNTGHANMTGSATVTLYLSSDSTASTADAVIKAIRVPLGTLKPGKSTKPVTFTLTLPAHLSDKHALVAVVTPNPAESTTLDNARPLSATFADPTVNLAATSLKIKKGKKPSATLAIKNTGNQPFNHATPIALSFTDSATGEVTTLPTLTTALNLKPAQLKSLNLKLTLPSALAGHHGTLTATLDPNHTLGQSSTDDDAATANL